LLLATGAIGASFLFQNAAFAQTDAPATPPADAAAKSDDYVVVITAQRKSERLQDVPIAVTALSTENLKDQRIETGSQLLQAVPNMTFQPGAFAKPDFVIRGIGYQLVTSTGEAGVAVHDNDAPLTISRIAQADFFDVDRIEVLRGPQGTLYGRNATGGVINTITAKPSSVFGASLTAEAGNFGAWKGQGYVNIPINDMFALRVAGDAFTYDGFQTNQFNGDHVNGVDRWAGRATLSFKPNDRFSSYLMYEHFDQRGGNGNGGNVRGVCLHDDGPTSVGGVAVTDPTIQAFESQGCAAASVYNPAVMTGVVNGIGDFGNRIALAIGLAHSDLLANNVRNPDPYSVDFDMDPYGRSKNDLYQFHFDQKITDALTLSGLLTYSDDNVKAGAGGLRAEVPFDGGVTADDPQIPLGPLAYWTNGTFNNLETREGSFELRLQSAYDGKWNYSIGANHVNLSRLDNVLIYDNINYLLGTNVLFMPVDLNGPMTADGGHYYFQSLNPYKLNSSAVFGEVYYKPTDKLTVTAGLRYTDDQKTFFSNTSAGNLLQGGGGTGYGVGYTFDPDPQFVEFKKMTGRLNFNYKLAPDSSLYASYSRGYKGGGFNPPNVITGSSYAPEFVNAYEIGSKNQFFDRSLTLNLTGFYYDYKGYQFTQADSLGTRTSNLDSRVWGVELESVWRPVDNLALNAQIGYLNTKIKNGESADPNNPTAGDPTYTFMKTLFGGCLVNTANFATLIDDIQTANNRFGYVPQASDLANLALGAGQNLCTNDGPHANEATDYGLFTGVPAGQEDGLLQPLSGNELPNDPNWTASAGAQYTFDLGPSWSLTPRFDYHYQGSTYADVFNTENFKTKAWSTANAAVTLASPDLGLNIQAYVKNIADNHDFTGVAPGGGAILGNPVSVVVQDPRTYGVSLTKRF
jgi:outer membrane receptor protein involved in Fe transport